MQYIYEGCFYILQLLKAMNLDDGWYTYRYIYTQQSEFTLIDTRDANVVGRERDCAKLKFLSAIQKDQGLPWRPAERKLILRCPAANWKISFKLPLFIRSASTAAAFELIRATSGRINTPVEYSTLYMYT